MAPSASILSECIPSAPPPQRSPRSQLPSLSMSLALLCVVEALATRNFAPTIRVSAATADTSNVAEAAITDHTHRDQLHHSANRLIHQSRFEDALRCYDFALLADNGSGSASRTWMLKALLLQRTGETEQARAAFQAGSNVMRSRSNRQIHENEQERREDAQLLQAHGLFEQRQGNEDLAYSLVRAAVAMDGSLGKILKWRMFRDRASGSVVPTSTQRRASMIRACASQEGDAGTPLDRRQPMGDEEQAAARAAVERLVSTETPKEVPVGAPLPATRLFDGLGAGGITRTGDAPGITKRLVTMMSWAATLWLRLPLSRLVVPAVLLIFGALFQSGIFVVFPDEAAAQRLIAEEGTVTDVQAYVLSDSSSFISVVVKPWWPVSDEATALEAAGV